MLVPVMKKIKFKSKVWIYPSTAASWYFVAVPELESKKLRVHQSKSFGILPVTVQVGKTKWDTSLFYSTQGKGYILPLKKLIRKKEGIQDGDTVEVQICIK